MLCVEFMHAAAHRQPVRVKKHELPAQLAKGTDQKQTRRLQLTASCFKRASHANTG